MHRAEPILLLWSSPMLRCVQASLEDFTIAVAGNMTGQPAMLTIHQVWVLLFDCQHSHCLQSPSGHLEQARLVCSPYTRSGCARLAAMSL